MAIKRTEGGRFDPDDRGCCFVATLPSQLLVATHNRHLLTPVNDVHGSSEREFALLIENPSNRIFLDSGVFAFVNRHARNHGLTMDEALRVPAKEIDDFEWLWNQYLKLTKQWGSELWGYTEIDQGGREEKRARRKQLEDLGLRPIPIYHPINDGLEYFYELAEQYDRIAVGNIVHASFNTRKRLLAAFWERKKSYPRLWLHALGLNCSPLMLAFPFESHDASSWLGGIRWSRWTALSCQTAFSSLDESFIYRLRSEGGGNRDVLGGYNFQIMLGGVDVAMSERSLRDYHRNLGSMKVAD